MNTRLAVTMILVLTLSGCAPEKTETTTRGHLHALFAESTAPAMVEEVSQFLSSYSKAGANITYEVVSSENALRRMLRDTLRYIVVTRPMSPTEQQQLPRIEGFDLNQIVIAYDGIAVVVNPRNNVENITTGEISKILSGEIRRWEQLSNAETMKGTIELLYQDSSDVSLFAESRLLQGKVLRKDIQKTTSSLATLRSVVERPLSIALVGMLWVDSAHVPAKVLKVAETRVMQDSMFRVPPERIGKFCTPHPANIYRNYYPLKRAIYAYTFGPMGSFASGFSNFVATKDGQKIFLDKNIVPGTQPIRLRAPE